jgi:hypothetical protein
MVWLNEGQPRIGYPELTSTLVSDLEPNPPSNTPPDAGPQRSTPTAATKHPQPELRDVELDSIPKKREPLNPAYAILAAAILSAGTAITATYLNIRSSERLQRERDRTDAAKKESDDLKAQLTALQTKLNETSNAVDALAENSEVSTSTTPGGPATSIAPALTSVPATAAPLPSIIVVLPSTPPTVLAVTPSAKPELKTEPKPEARVEAPTTPPATQPATTTVVPTTVATTPATTASVPASMPAAIPPATPISSTPQTTKAP